MPVLLPSEPFLFSRRGGSATASAPSNTVAPVASGPGEVGQEHTVTDGTWSGFPTPSFSYQWQIDTGGGFTNVGTDAPAYTPTQAGTLRCVVTATNSQGSAPANSNTVTINIAQGAFSSAFSSAFDIAA